MRHAGTFQISTYAIPMLEYGDTTGLTDLDIELVNGFIEANFPHGYVVDWTGIEQPYFASHPEFGIAAEVVEADFYKQGGSIRHSHHFRLYSNDTRDIQID